MPNPSTDEVRISEWAENVLRWSWDGPGMVMRTPEDG